jgi:hypothetical protein
LILRMWAAHGHVGAGCRNVQPWIRISKNPRYNRGGSKSIPFCRGEVRITYRTCGKSGPDASFPAALKIDPIFW